MRALDSYSTAALASSRPGDTLTVWVWYGGKLAFDQPLKIGAWQASWDITRQVQTIDLEVLDPEGTKTPWLLDDALGVAGSRLQVFYNIGGARSIPWEWYRIVKPEPEETWRSYQVTDRGVVHVDTPIPANTSLRYTSGGAKIQLSAETIVRNVANDRFLAPGSPVGSSPTVVSEVTRLLRNHMHVVALPGVVDASVPKNLVYKDDRLNAVQDLCKRIGCDYRTNGAGQLEIYPIANQGPVWTLAPGPEGFQIDVSRDMQLDGQYNVFVVDGATPSTSSTSTQPPASPVRGYARIEGGPLKVDYLRHGAYPTFYQSDMITTQQQAEAYAATMRDSQLAGLTVDLKATCLPHPGLQQGDWITVSVPTTTPATLVSFPARITTIDMSGRDGTVDPMLLGLTATYADVAAVFQGVPRG